jgi:polyhydroxybutyrate depolymerase
MHWTIDGVQRSALVFPPVSTTGAATHPLVFAFHGHGGNAQGTALQMHIQTVWPQAIVVYPQGLNSPTPGDPSATKPGWQFKAGDSNDRDLKLFDAMIATLKQRYHVDARRIYTTGFSNGGIFSYLLWAERAKTIAAVGEVAGALDSSETLTTPRALLAIAGKQDTTNPFANQVASIERARQADNATGSGTPCGRSAPSTCRRAATRRPSRRTSIQAATCTRPGLRARSSPSSSPTRSPRNSSAAALKRRRCASRSSPRGLLLGPLDFETRLTARLEGDHLRRALLFDPLRRRNWNDMQAHLASYRGFGLDKPQSKSAVYSTAGISPSENG